VVTVGATNLAASYNCAVSLLSLSVQNTREYCFPNNDKSYGSLRSLLANELTLPDLGMDSCLCGA